MRINPLILAQNSFLGSGTELEFMEASLRFSDPKTGAIGLFESTGNFLDYGVDQPYGRQFLRFESVTGARKVIRGWLGQDRLDRVDASLEGDSMMPDYYEASLMMRPSTLPASMAGMIFGRNSLARTVQEFSAQNPNKKSSITLSISLVQNGAHGSQKSILTNSYKLSAIERVTAWNELIQRLEFQKESVESAEPGI